MKRAAESTEADSNAKRPKSGGTLPVDDEYDDMMLDEDFAYEPQASGLQATSRTQSVTTAYNKSATRPTASGPAQQQSKPPQRRSRGDDDDDVDDMADEDMDDMEDEIPDDVDGVDDGSLRGNNLDDLLRTFLSTKDTPEEVERRATWLRPALTQLPDPAEKSLVFQQIDIDYKVSASLGDVPLFRKQSAHRGPVPRTRHVPVVRMYGVTANGHSVLAHVYGFEPYFYIESPDRNMTDAQLSMLQKAMNSELLRREAKDKSEGSDEGMLPVVRIERELKSSIMHFRFGQKTPFLKIVCSLPKYVPTLRGILQKGIDVPGFNQFIFRDVYEADVLFVLRFMIDTKVVGGNWIELPAGKYLHAGDTSRSVSAKMKAQFGVADEGPDWRIPGRESISQLEVWVHVDDLISHAPSGDWDSIAPLRIFSFDIECAGRKGIFPEPEHDRVIQIATVVTHYGLTSVAANAPPASTDDRSTSTDPSAYRPLVIRTVFTLGSCSAIAGTQVIACETESELFMRWRDFMTLVDPDIVTGYNINNFDLPYLMDRAKKLNLRNFPLFSRLARNPCRAKDTRFSSSAYGTRESKEIAMPGRVVLDVLQAIQRDYKLSSYSLNAVSAHFLGEQKEDVHHSIISTLQDGNEDSRRRLAVYCLKDALLPQRLLERLMIIPNYLEMARVTGVPLNFLLARGQQIKVISQLLRKTRLRDIVVPGNNQKRGNNGDEPGYEGATVIEPKKGFYERPIATLDFASLYPSIMMAHNLCYTTLVRKSEMSRLNEVEEQERQKELAKAAAEGVDVMLPADKNLAYTKTPTGDLFVSPRVQKGILPEILEELLAARKRAKQDLAKATDPLVKAVLDGRQLALKVSANSVYGFTGATVGRLPCLEISASVTSFGREMIDFTKRTVEEQYPGAVVVYGDTDSVMIDFGVEKDDVATAMKFGKEASTLVSAKFVRPISLEFEKVYAPFLLINKKRYAALLWTKPDKYDKMDCKGIETVRRDNCALVRTVIDTVLRKILVERSVEGAKTYVRNTISDLLRNRLDISMLVITKALSKEGADYQAKQAHVELAERMRKRDAGTAPNIGDRVPYVIIKGAKGAKAFEKAEDPIYVLENNIPIDTQHYLEHQLSQPLIRIFEGVMSKPESLLSGEHTRVISVPTPVGGIMKFAKKTMQCLGCRSPLPADQQDQPLCRHCIAKEADIYKKNLASVCELEVQFGQLWTECQRCQGALHADVLCTNRDCPIFYMRKKVQKDLKDAQETLDRFAW